MEEKRPWPDALPDVKFAPGRKIGDSEIRPCQMQVSSRTKMKEHGQHALWAVIAQVTTGLLMLLTVSVNCWVCAGASGKLDKRVHWARGHEADFQRPTVPLSKPKNTSSRRTDPVRSRTAALVSASRLRPSTVRQGPSAGVISIRGGSDW